MTDRKAVIKNADMSEDMQQDAVDCATQAMEKYNIEKDIAAYIKKVRQDGSKHSSCELSSVAHELRIHSFFLILRSIFGQCAEKAPVTRAVDEIFFITEVMSPKVPL